MSAREPVVGDVLAGRYRLVAPLGRGGMGAVWRAEHLVLSSPVAVKLIHARAAEAPEAQARFLREAQAAAALRSPHVVHVLDYGVEDGVPFIVMELLEGESLQARLGRLGALPPAHTAQIVTHVARAIQRAHESGIVHRDLKPDNVFLVHNADDEIAKVLDFGIAKVADGFGDAGAATHTGAVLGSPHYMSPEQARGTRAVDHRSDLWALGVIAFVCLTGRRPFESDTLGDLLMRICAEPIVVPSQVAAVPAGFDAWFARATERDPDRRFQSATELAESFRVLVGAPPSTLSATSLPPPSSVSAPAAPRPSGSHGLVVLGLGIVALLGALGVVGAVAVVWSTRDSASPEVAPAPPGVSAPTPVALPAPAAADAGVIASDAGRAPSARARSASISPKPAAADTSASNDPAAKLQEAEAKIKAAEQKIKAAEEKMKAAGVQ